MANESLLVILYLLFLNIFRRFGAGRAATRRLLSEHGSNYPEGQARVCVHPQAMRPSVAPADHGQELKEGARDMVQS